MPPQRPPGNPALPHSLRGYTTMGLYWLLGFTGPWLGDWTGFPGTVLLLGLVLSLVIAGLGADERRTIEPRTTSAAILTAETANTVVLVSGLLVVDLVGFAATSPDYMVAQLLLGLGALGSIFLWRPTARRVGPKHLLDLLLLFWALLVTLLAIYRGLGLPGPLFFLIAPLLGATYAGLRLAQLRPGTPGQAPARRVRLWSGWTEAAVAGPLLWLVLAPLGAHVLGLLLLLVATLVAFSLLRGVPDPWRPGPGPLARVGPWGDRSGQAVPGGARRFLSAPFLSLYLAVSWALFLPFARPVDGFFAIDEDRWRPFLYYIPDLLESPLRALRSLVTAPFLNHDSVQVIYVTVLLALFGLVFEAKEGTWRTLLVFFGTTFVGALVASLLLHLIYPGVSDDRFFQRAWDRTWSGGSVGAFGLMGALAARAPVPWPLLGFFVFWELNVGWWYLQSYTPAFHLTALATGFLLARYVLRPRWSSQEPARERPEASPK